MRSLESAWGHVQNRIKSKKKKLLILDFDGTLAKIARTPSEVVLKKETAQILERLSDSKRYQLVVISGRSLESLRSFISINRAILVGNHGLELKGARIPMPQKAKKARKLEALVWLVGEKLREVLTLVPGMLIEDKGYTLSLHYRKVPRQYLTRLNQEVVKFKKMYRHWPIHWRSGKRVWEIRPAVQWGKGEMALYLSKKFPKALPIVIGDDITDEDMFSALKNRGITIHVGNSPRSCAKYSLRSPKAVTGFLRRLSEL